MLSGPGATWDISRRFLGGEISLDEAARQIVAIVRREEIWGLTYGSHMKPEISKEEEQKAKELLDRVVELLKEDELDSK